MPPPGVAPVVQPQIMQQPVGMVAQPVLHAPQVAIPMVQGQMLQAPAGMVPMQQAQPMLQAQPLQMQPAGAMMHQPQPIVAAAPQAVVAQQQPPPMLPAAATAQPMVAAAAPAQPMAAAPSAQLAAAAKPPPFAAAPADGALAQRILKLAEFVHRNGPAFEVQVRNKQGSSPDYAFLNWGLGSDYYRWAHFCIQRNLPVDQPLPDGWSDAPPPAAAAPAAAPAAAAAPPLPAEVSSGFAHVLQILQGSQVRMLALASVKFSKRATLENCPESTTIGLFLEVGAGADGFAHV